MGSVVCHATYLINLGATDDAVYARSVRALASTVAVAGHRRGGRHLPRRQPPRPRPGRRHAPDRARPAGGAGRARPDGPWLLLENSAGHQGTIGVTLEELELIIDELGRPERVGICLDTCHLFASGIDIPTPEGVDALLDEVDERIGLDRLRCLHVNDSKMPFDSHRDRHANVGEGEIGRSWR